MAKAKLLGEIVITDYQKITISIVEFRDEDRLDIRTSVDVNKDRENPEWILTKKGVQIPSTEWEHFYNIIQKKFKSHL